MLIGLQCLDAIIQSATRGWQSVVSIPLLPSSGSLVACSPDSVAEMTFQRSRFLLRGRKEQVDYVIIITEPVPSRHDDPLIGFHQAEVKQVFNGAALI